MRSAKTSFSSLGLNRVLYGTHTMSLTNALLIYRRTKNIRTVPILHGHTELESTVWYLGIEVDDALDMASKLKCGQAPATG